MLENNFLYAIRCLEEAAALKAGCDGGWFAAFPELQRSENKSTSALFTTNVSCWRIVSVRIIVLNDCFLWFSSLLRALQSRAAV